MIRIRCVGVGPDTELVPVGIFVETGLEIGVARCFNPQLEIAISNAIR
jgi:hypothetical protein